MKKNINVDSDYFEKDAFFIILYLSISIPLASTGFVIDNDINGLGSIAKSVLVGVVIQLVFIAMSSKTKQKNNLFGTAKYPYKGLSGIAGLATITAAGIQVCTIATAIVLNITGNSSDRLIQAFAYCVAWILSSIIFDTVYRECFLKDQNRQFDAS